MPKSETVIRINDDIYQVRLPLPFALRIANCYLLRGSNGWAIFDTGLNIPQGQATWLAAFDALGIRPRDIRRIVLTHYHPDHYGMAGWLQALCRDNAIIPPVMMSSREAELAELVWGDKYDISSAMLKHMGMCGMPDEILAVASQSGRTRDAVLPLPDAVEIVQAGSIINMGGRRFQAIHASGHSDGQLLFYDADDRMLFCGDHVLVGITPNIGLWPAAEPDPLGRYLASLHELATLDVRLALPGHRPLITDWRGRLAELEKHHAERLGLMIAAVNGSRTVYQVCSQVFDIPALSLYELRFAVTETLAHLEYLTDLGHLRREDDPVLRYTRA